MSSQKIIKPRVMKKNKQKYHIHLVSIWGKPAKSPLQSKKSSVQQILSWFLVVRLYVDQHPALGRFIDVLTFFAGYFVLYYLPYKFTIENTGAYFAVALILWPIVFLFVQIFIWELKNSLRKNWHGVDILKSENGSIYGVLKFKKQHKHLYWPFQYQFFYKKVDIDGEPCSELFILCKDQQNQQFILSTTLKYLPERCTNASEIADIPVEWYQMDFLICKGKYLLRYLRHLTKLEATPQNGTKEPNL